MKRFRLKKWKEECIVFNKLYTVFSRMKRRKLLAKIIKDVETS